MTVIPVDRTVRHLRDTHRSLRAERLRVVHWRRLVRARMELAAAAVALPAINVLALTIQNAAALLFPAWVRLGTTRPGGVEAMGQSLITTVATLFLLLLLLALPAGAGAALIYLLLPAMGDWAAAPGLLLTVAMVALEMVPIARWLGRVFERTDPTAVNPS